MRWLWGKSGKPTPPPSVRKRMGAGTSGSRVSGKITQGLSLGRKQMLQSIAHSQVCNRYVAIRLHSIQNAYGWEKQKNALTLPQE